MNNMKPKEVKSAYTYYTEEFVNNYRKAKPTNKSTFEELVQTCGKMYEKIWESMSNEEKKRYYDMSHLDEKRYNNDLNNIKIEEKKNETNKEKDNQIKKIIPKEVKSAYSYYTEEFVNNYRTAKPTNQSTFEELVKICGKMCEKMWESMSHTEKKKYYDMSLLDEKRYKNDLNNIEIKEKKNEINKEKDNQIKKITKKRKASKNEPLVQNPPKRPWSSYLYFCDDHRKDVKEKNPNLKSNDVTKTLSKM